MIFDEVLADWQHDDPNRRLPPLPTIEAEHYWTWHDRARAMAHLIYAERGWEALTLGPLDGRWQAGVEIVEEAVAREVNGERTAVNGCIAGLTKALAELDATQRAAGRISRVPSTPAITGPIPLPLPNRME
jgi:hypothetical protein